MWSKLALREEEVEQRRDSVGAAEKKVKAMEAGLADAQQAAKALKGAEKALKIKQVWNTQHFYASKHAMYAFLQLFGGSIIL